MGPGGEELPTVSCKAFDVWIFIRLARSAKDNTAGADVICDRTRDQD
jgi:hypothetical protein